MRTGVLAGALLSILTLVFFATDRLSFLHHHTPAEMGVALSGLTVSDPVTLTEFEERTHLSPASFTLPLPRSGLTGGVAKPQYVSDEVTTIAPPQTDTTAAQGPTGTTASTGTTTNSTATTSTTAPATSTTTSSTAAPSTSGTTSTTSSTTTTGAPSGPPLLSLGPMFTGPASHIPASAVTVAKLRNYLATKASGSGPFGGIQGPITTDLKVICTSGVFFGAAEGCPINVVSRPGGGVGPVGGGNLGGSNPDGASNPAGGNNSSGGTAGGGRNGGQPSTGKRDASISEGVAQAILTVFGHTRTRDHQPLGVIVNYHVTVNGFVGRGVVIRWTLWSARHGSGEMTALPEQWLQDRPIETLVGQALEDRAAPAFWIPLPKEPGPFVVVVSAYDASGVRLDDEPSPSFD